MQLTIPFPQLRRLLLILWATFALTGFTVEIIHHLVEFAGTPLWVEIFSLSYEDNVPSWYSSCLLFSCAVVLGCIAWRHIRRHFWASVGQ